MCLPQPKLPEQKPFIAPKAPEAPPPPQETATSLKPAGEAAPKKRNKNPLRTDSGATDSVATGLNIPS